MGQKSHLDSETEIQKEVSICWWEPEHERELRPEKHSLVARLLFRVLQTINRVMLLRQMRCLLLVARLLLLAVLLRSTSCILCLWITSLLPD